MLEVIKDYWRYIILIIILIIIGIVSFFFFNKYHHREEVNNEEPVIKEVAIEEKKEEIKEEQKEEKKKVNVDIKGAVKKPGVYSLDEGSLVNDAIKLAGLKSSASTKNINLSKKLVDEMVIIVYTTKELMKQEPVEVKEEECATKEVVISECEGSSIVIPKDNANNDDNKNDTTNDNKQTQEENSKVNINKATKEEIMTLSGIGESKALAIIKYREENNGFKDISEIMNVSGIGEALFNKIKEFITI